MTTGNDLLMQGTGTPWCKFPTIGTTCRGTILAEPISQQQRDFKDNTKLSTWDDGRPRMEVVVKIQTDIRGYADNPERAAAGGEDDDGVRALHIATPSNMARAIQRACRAAKMNGLHPGGILAVTFIGEDEPKGRMEPAKQYAATYEPPPSSGNSALMDNGSAGAAGNGATSSDTDDPGPPKPPNVPPGKWAEMSVEQRYGVVAAIKAMADSGIATEQPPF